MRRLATPYGRLVARCNRLEAQREQARIDWLAMVKRCAGYLREIDELKRRIAELEEVQSDQL